MRHSAPSPSAFPNLDGALIIPLRSIIASVVRSLQLSDIELFHLQHCFHRSFATG